MTTEQEWTYIGSEIWKAGEVAKGTAPRGVWSVSVGSGVQHLGFDPAPTEARAACRMPKGGNLPITREAVHAFIRAHGSVEECEAITPAYVDQEPNYRCPGCAGACIGAVRACVHNPDSGRCWHHDCLNRVRSRTEAARSGEPEPEWLDIALDVLPDGFSGYIEAGNFWLRAPWAGVCTASVIAIDKRGVAEAVRSMVRWLAARDGQDDPYAPAPVQPVEPRPFKSGDRVRNGSLVGVVTGTDYADRGYEVHVDWEDGQAFWCAPKCLTLVTPAPEEPACDEVFVPDGHATPAGVVTRAGIVNDVFGVYVRPDRPRPYDEGGTNPAGFPVMPEPPVCSECGYPAERDGMCMTHYEEAVRERSEVDQGPRVGDLVSWIAATATAGPHTVTDERRGIVVPHDDDGKRAPEGYVMARSKGTDGNAWTTVAVEACTVVRRKEEL